MPELHNNIAWDCFLALLRQRLPPGHKMREQLADGVFNDCYDGSADGSTDGSDEEAWSDGGAVPELDDT